MVLEKKVGYLLVFDGVGVLKQKLKFKQNSLLIACLSKGSLQFLYLQEDFWLYMPCENSSFQLAAYPYIRGW